MNFRLSVFLVWRSVYPPPLDSETSWTGELWSNTNLLRWQNKENNHCFPSFQQQILYYARPKIYCVIRNYVHCFAHFNYINTLFYPSVNQSKMLAFFTISLLLLGFSASAQDDIGCFVAGKCTDSNTVGISFPADPNGCLQVIGTNKSLDSSQI